jgi:uncharacterized protein (TIGR00255 family)
MYNDPMRSMTGHGRATVERAGRRATVEIRSVNHRFLDLKLRGASVAPAVEEQVSARVREQVERGAVTVTVHVERRGEAAALRLDHEAARAAHAELGQLARDLALAPPDLALILAQPGVVVAEDDLAEDETAAAAVLEAAGQALTRLAAMRDTEGRTLARDLGGRLESLRDLLTRIESAAAAQPEDVRRRLGERLARLLDETRAHLDPTRLAQEVAVLADRADVTEEIVRARSHLDQVRGLLGGATAPKGGVGRRLDFLVQELGREINTIGSKSSSGEISALVVEAKAELEKIREQAQNIE